jgi:large subunit ribosomal protein L25
MEIGSILHLSEIPMPAGVALAHAPDPDEPVIVMHGARSGAQGEGEEGAEGGG